MHTRRGLIKYRNNNIALPSGLPSVVKTHVSKFYFNSQVIPGPISQPQSSIITSISSQLPKVVIISICSFLYKTSSQKLIYLFAQNPTLCYLAENINFTTCATSTHSLSLVWGPQTYLRPPVTQVGFPLIHASQKAVYSLCVWWPPPAVYWASVILVTLFWATGCTISPLQRHAKWKRWCW